MASVIFIETHDEQCDALVFLSAEKVVCWFTTTTRILSHCVLINVYIIVYLYTILSLCAAAKYSVVTLSQLTTT